MVNNSYPKYGDIIVIDFDPQIGVEMKKRRPAIVVSADEFQKRTGRQRRVYSLLVERRRQVQQRTDRFLLYQ